MGAATVRRYGSRDETREGYAMTETTTLWRPTGPRKLDLVRASGWRAWPPRLPDQPV